VFAPLNELITSAIIALVLVGLGGFYLVHEHRRHARRSREPGLVPVDREHFSRQYRRRTCGSVLLIVAGLAVFAGANLVDARQQPRLFGWFWIGVMLLVLGLVALATAEVGAIVRYGRRHQRQLADDTRAMIDRQLAAYRARSTGRTSRDDPFAPESPERN
jgi:hypothetical protein